MRDGIKYLPEGEMKVVKDDQRGNRGDQHLIMKCLRHSLDSNVGQNLQTKLK